MRIRLKNLFLVGSLRERKFFLLLDKLVPSCWCINIFIRVAVDTGKRGKKLKNKSVDRRRKSRVALCKHHMLFTFAGVLY